MSFILDALRKSEHERQRQTGPALVEAAVAAPKPKPNTWASAAIALLIVNLVAVGVLLLVKSRDEPAAAAATAAQASAPAGIAAAPAAARAPAAAQATVTQTLPEPQVAATAPPPMLRPAEASVAAGTRNPLENEMSSYAPPMDYEAAAAAAAPPPGPAAVTPSRQGSVVYQSLPEANAPEANDSPRNSAAANLPTVDDIAGRSGLPEMRLELHVYSNKPQERFVFVNGRRYREGDTTADGAVIEEITRDGVVMTVGGNRFLLPRD